MMKYAAIILSGGYSSRMGDFKPLMKLGEYTALERCVNLFKNSGIEDIYIVVGYQWRKIKEFVGNRVQVIYNEDFDKGMLSSVKTGVENLACDIDAFFVLPVDIPSVKSFTIKLIIDKYEKGNYKIVYPTFSEKRGHPPLISTSISKDILEYDGPGGLRNILYRYERYSKNVQVIDRGILMDMDTQEDYNTILDYISYHPCPDEYECKEMMRLCGTKDETALHMKCVGELSKIIAEKLNEKDCKIDVQLTYSGGCLHDIGKGKKNHAREGALIVKKFGYPYLFDVIDSHMDIHEVKTIGEKEVVYLADKLVKGTRFVDLEERFRPGFEKYKNRPDIIDNINRRLYIAKKIKGQIEDIIGCSIEELRENVWKDLYIS